MANDKTQYNFFTRVHDRINYYGMFRGAFDRVRGYDEFLNTREIKRLEQQEAAQKVAQIRSKHYKKVESQKQVINEQIPFSMENMEMPIMYQNFMESANDNYMASTQASGNYNVLARSDNMNQDIMLIEENEQIHQDSSMSSTDKEIAQLRDAVDDRSSLLSNSFLSKQAPKQNDLVDKMVSEGVLQKKFIETCKSKGIDIVQALKKHKLQKPTNEILTFPKSKKVFSHAEILTFQRLAQKLKPKMR